MYARKMSFQRRIWPKLPCIIENSPTHVRPKRKGNRLLEMEVTMTKALEGEIMFGWPFQFLEGVARSHTKLVVVVGFE